MPENKNKNLLQMHHFYTEEARHQRTMMWETVKWFTPILTLIAGVWIKYSIDNFLVCRNYSLCVVLLGLSILGIVLSVCCVFLLRSFYRSNLKYITMFAKVEEELQFDQTNRGGSKYFPGDKHITWENWRYERRHSEKSTKLDANSSSKPEEYNSQYYLKTKLRDKFCEKIFKVPLLLRLMQFVFIFFGLMFFGSIILLVLNLLT